MTEIITKHYNKSFKNLKYKSPLLHRKSKIRQNKHIDLATFKKSAFRKTGVVKFKAKNFIRDFIYKRRLEDIDVYYEDKNGNLRLKRKPPTWKERCKYKSRNKRRFWKYLDKSVQEQKNQNFLNQVNLSKKYHKKRYHVNKIFTTTPFSRSFIPAVHNFNKYTSFSKKLRILTKKIYYCLLNKKHLKKVLIEKRIRRKRFLAHFLPYKLRLIKWKLKLPEIVSKNFIRRFFYNKRQLNIKHKQRKWLAKGRKRLFHYLTNYLQYRKQVLNYNPRGSWNMNKALVAQYQFSIKLILRRKNMTKYIGNIGSVLSLKKMLNNNRKFSLTNWLQYQKRLYLCQPKLKVQKLKLLKKSRKLKKIFHANKKQKKKRFSAQNQYIKNKRRYFAKKKKLKARRRLKKYKRKINYKWYKNFADNHEVLVRISKKNLIKLESPFFKKLKSYKKFKYLVTPKKYKNIFKNFHFKNIIWRKSFLLNKKFRKHELASKKQVIKEYNWKKTRKEPWHTKRAKWLSWTLHPKHKSSPFFIGTHVWNNRWNDYFKQNILQKINKNKHIPTQAYISEVRPFIRHLIFQQKHLPTNYIHNNYKLLYLVVQDIAKTYWTDKIFNPDNSEEIIWGFENLSEKDTEDDLPEIIAAEADPLIFFDEIEPFFSELFHDIKKSSFILYKNWPRQIFQDTILLKNIHKRMKVIENSSRKERLEYKDPQPRFDKFHRLFSIDWRIKRAAPWFEPLFFPRILHPVQYFNFWYSKKSIYIRKRSKIYRKFSKEAFNLYEPIKYRSYRRGGHRNFNWNRILSKVLMPFFGKTFSQFQSSFNELRTKKSKQIGRTNAFIKNLNSQLYRLIYNFNSAPSIFWARKIVEIGWVYVSHLKIQNNTKAIFNSISIDNLFPLLSINKNYAYSSNKLAKFTQLPIRAQSNKVNNGATVSINPLIKLLIKEFFSRRLAWDRRVTPSYGILNRKKTVMIISQQRYKDNFSEYTKDRSNTKRFPFFYN